MKSKMLVYTCCLCPRFEDNIYIRWGGQVENTVFCGLFSAVGHPTQRLLRQRQVDRLLCLLHDHLQPILPVVDIDILPFQPDNIANAQTAEAGEQVSLFYYFIFHRRVINVRSYSMVIPSPACFLSRSFFAFSAKNYFCTDILLHGECNSF